MIWNSIFVFLPLLFSDSFCFLKSDRVLLVHLILIEIRIFVLVILKWFVKIIVLSLNLLKAVLEVFSVVNNINFKFCLKFRFWTIFMKVTIRWHFAFHWINSKFIIRSSLNRLNRQFSLKFHLCFYYIIFILFINAVYNLYYIVNYLNYK
jgi:hypothetical protein